jgi:hypothetical protein
VPESEESRPKVGASSNEKAYLAFSRNRRNICKYFEDYDSNRKPRSGHLAFLRWLL